ncbi:MAG TPA: O-antigen ligase family protein [Gaiellaceae bacterium]|nr:O-antigen ligase family protein [Gaiellaceae bacterium]
MPLTEWLFFATVFTVTFAKVHWAVGGDLSLSDVLTGLFLVAFAVRRLERWDSRFARPAGVTFVFFVAFLLVYLIGFFNLGTTEALDQWGKGMVKFLLHFLFLVTGVSLVVRGGERLYWRAVAVFLAGIAANALYGVLQLGVAVATGGNLDAAVLSPITGGASQINIYGAVSGQSVYRPNALTGDPNHLGIELTIPLLVLLPLYLRLPRSSRWRTPAMLLLAFLLVMELATLSRSGLLGLAAGLLVLALPYRRHLLSGRVLWPLAGVAVLLLAIVAQRRHFFETVLRSRVQTDARGTSTHFAVYDFIPQILHSHPLFGLGLNTFSVYYEFVTGRTNFGPHSFYVALVVETGLVGTVLFAAFVWFLFRRLRAARAVGRALQALRDPLAARVRPLAWGLTAALVSTLAANVFYLTMSFYYFFVLALLVVCAPTVFARRLVR